MDRNIVRRILLRIDELKAGESILVDDLNKEFPEVKTEEFLTIISGLVARCYIHIDGKFAHEYSSVEKYNKITGLDRDGLEVIDYIRNEKIWSIVERTLNENGYSDFSIFTAIDYAKKIVNSEFERIIKNEDLIIE